MNSPLAMILTAMIAVSIISLAHKWELDQLQFQIEKRDAVIDALQKQPRQQVNVTQNNNSGLTGKQEGK